MKKQNAKKKIILVSCFLVLIGLLILSLRDALVSNSKNSLTKIPVKEENWRNQIKIALEDPSYRAFTSKDLGLSFKYASSSADRVWVKQIGKRVYLYSDIMAKAEDGVFVEVFDKNPSSSLTQSVKEKFLKGYNEEKCLLEQYEFTARSTFPATYDFVQITLPGKIGESGDELSARAQRDCPGEYVWAPQRGFFMADSQHPSKMLFVRTWFYMNFFTNFPWDFTIRYI